MKKLVWMSIILLAAAAQANPVPMPPARENAPVAAGRPQSRNMTPEQQEKMKAAMKTRFEKMTPEERAQRVERLTQSLERLQARKEENKTTEERLIMELTLLKSVR